MSNYHNKLIILATQLFFLYFRETVQEYVKPPYTYHSYQRSIICVSKYHPSYPRSLQEIQDIVRYAVSHNITLKALGSRHSITDSICTTGIPLSLTHIRHFSFNRKTNIATVGAGVELQDLYEKLHQYHRAISGLPTYSGITVGGALALGAHGTGLRYPGTISQQIVSLTVVDGRGKVRKITKDNEDFPAFQVSLGLLGVIYEVELATERQYKMTIKHYPVRDSLIRDHNDDRLVQYAKHNDYFQFWWFPTNQQITLAIGNRVSVNASGNCETRYVSNVPWLARSTMAASLETLQVAKDDIGYFNLQSLAMERLYTEVLAREPMFVKADQRTASLPEATGYGFRLTSNKCQDCAWDGTEGNAVMDEGGSVAIPIEKLLPALRSLEMVFATQLTQFPVKGILVRFVSGGNGYMAINEQNREWAVIEWTSVSRWDKSQPKLGIAGFQMMGQLLVKEYGGIPHWGKNGLYYSNPELVRKTHPNLDKFVQAMKTYDPMETFINHFGERIKHNKEYYTASAEQGKTCALNELCICQVNRDCGNEQALDYVCADFPGFFGYKVCLPGQVERAKEQYSKTVIDTLAVAR